MEIDPRISEEKECPSFSSDSGRAKTYFLFFSLLK